MTAVCHAPLRLVHHRSARAAALPPWEPSMCNGCTVPTLLRWIPWLAPEETAAQRAVCCIHDEAYYYGGTAEDRLKADQALYRGLVRAGMAEWRAWLYYVHVRIYGSIYWTPNERRWSWGGAFYQYEELQEAA